MRAQLAGGGDDRFAQNFEASELLQREAEINFFAGEILFIETADRFERFAPGEKKCARAEPGRKIDGAKVHSKRGAEKRESPVAPTRAPPPAVAFAKRQLFPSDVAGRDVGIGIHEKQNFAAGKAGAGIARGGDLPAIYRNEAGAELRGDFSGRVGRSVVHHDQFVVSPARPSAARRIPRRGSRQFVLLVMRRDDERNFGAASRAVFSFRNRVSVCQAKS